MIVTCQWLSIGDIEFAGLNEALSIIMLALTHFVGRLPMSENGVIGVDPMCWLRDIWTSGVLVESEYSFAPFIYCPPTHNFVMR